MAQNELPAKYHAIYIAIEILVLLGLEGPSQAQIDVMEDWVTRCVHATDFAGLVSAIRL